MLKRRSAVAFDGVGSVSREVFMGMLLRTMPAATPPWDALWWPPRVHLLLFVHRVAGLDAGLYVAARRADAVDGLRAVITREFEWRRLDEGLPLFRLASGDCRSLARRLCCDQDIAADGFFSLGMLAELDAALASDGAPAYRHLFWECGLIGQVLYLEAEAWGARATGIGCFYDDPVHEVLGLTSAAIGRPLQSLYHFTVGAPVEDVRLASEPGYEWEIEDRFRA
jgi:hypothetical protein